MERTQISLPAEDLSKAKTRAAGLGISLAEYIRRLIADDLGGHRPVVDVSAIFGLGSSGGSDVSQHKDEYVGAAVEAEYAEDVQAHQPT